MSDTVFGYSAEALTAVGTAILALETLALAGAAIWQLSALIEQLRLAREADAKADRRLIETNTLRVCERYYGDPVIAAATARIWAASQGGVDYGAAAISSHDLITVLNYLDGIAVGIKQHVYSPEIVKDHMESTFVKIIDVIRPAVVPRVLPDWKGYEAISELRNGWLTVAVTSYSHRP